MTLKEQLQEAEKNFGRVVGDFREYRNRQALIDGERVTHISMLESVVDDLEKKCERVTVDAKVLHEAGARLVDDNRRLAIANAQLVDLLTHAVNNHTALAQK